ncbi:hypothetical protein FA13DRAFT_1760251 [Coprinellus micaceus]|uniref:S-adenosyl-L-methionine-dependent methyltransferase n=1 Tax=Coprinellus micaceus TaxID=71717 RepID=A0A4Y7R892_COPMI|nr:hypothetical protein FA13DRAFT_1760251 [Coprinellus micaceus]
MIPTPDLSHLTSKDYNLVYEPAGPHLPLLDALEADLETLKGAEPRICLEIGSGSGCVSTFFARALVLLYICTDINPHANRATQATGRQNRRLQRRPGGIGGAWAGGWDGMEVTNKFLEQVEGLLSENGRFYLVALKQNNVPEIRERMLQRFQLKSEIVIERRAGREYLYILHTSGRDRHRVDMKMWHL